jgi:hypothetical protein
VFLYRIPTTILPEGMSARVILPGDRSDKIETGAKSEPESDSPSLTITAFPSQTQSGWVDLVVRALIPVTDVSSLPEQLSRLEKSIAGRLEALMPFCGNNLKYVEVTPPQWDSDDGLLEDSPPGTGWPAEIDLRLSTRPPIYHLDRAAVAGLGLEGDLLLGWRGGDAIAAELA